MLRNFFMPFEYVKPTLNCELGRLAELASECFCIHFMILFVFSEVFEHTFIFFLCHIQKQGMSFSASIPVTEQVSNPTKCQHFPQ